MTRSSTIPNWNNAGVIPPVVVEPGEDAAGGQRSPYRCTILDLAQQFGSTPARQRILLGFIDYRRAIVELGVREGFQWVNGSILQDVERLEGRPPNDVDVVTFTSISDETRTRLGKRPDLYQKGLCKEKYQTDCHFFWFENLEDRVKGIHLISYWYSLWSHRRRDFLWKGFLELPLIDPTENLAYEHLKGLQSQTSAASEKP